jgi:hypothetical protein
MKLKRFEILLPLNYNDGRLIEREKFLATHRELVGKFRATTVESYKLPEVGCTAGRSIKTC